MLNFNRYLETHSVSLGAVVRIKDTSLPRLKDEGVIAGDPGRGVIEELLPSRMAKVACGFYIYELPLSDLELDQR